MRSYFSMVCGGSISPLPLRRLWGMRRTGCFPMPQNGPALLQIRSVAAHCDFVGHLVGHCGIILKISLRCIFEGEAIGLRVSIWASGSSGNITLLETERPRLLVDAGLGKRETLARFAAVEGAVDHIDGILITHEHTDHCNGLPQMLGLWKHPLYVTEPTLGAMQRQLPETFGKRLRGVECIPAGQSFSIG